jgi:apolipoprotein N-acyltransferase
VALAPLLVALAGGPSAPITPVTPRRGFRLGLVAGAVSFAGTLYWTADVMVLYGGLPRPAAAPIAGLLVAYLSLYPAAFAWIVARGLRAHGPRAIWLAPVAWTATEFVRGFLFTGFPWVALGYSQVPVLPVAQLASLGGVALLSLAVSAVSTGLAVAAMSDRKRAARVLVATGAVVVAVAAWGQWRMSRGTLTSDGTPLRVGVAQGNVAQGQKWDPAHADRILGDYLALTRDLAAQGARLVVWPETATPFFFEEEPTGRAAIVSMAVESNVWLLFGSDQIVRPDFYNVAFLVSPEGRQEGVYRKMHLVPFGEYVPLRRLLFFAAPLVETVGDFAVGTEVTLLPVDGHPVTTAICYESVFPYLAREAVARGSQLLTVVTNDAWYGWSSAPYQHYQQGRLRAIEFGRYFVRSANTGFSAIVDPYGRVVASSGLFEQAALVGDVRLLTSRTVYATIGDSVAWACVAVTLAAYLASRPRRPAARSRIP